MAIGLVFQGVGFAVLLGNIMCVDIEMKENTGLIRNSEDLLIQNMAKMNFILVVHSIITTKPVI